MTEIDFYFHVKDRLRTACTLSAKAYARGLRVLAFCPDREAGQKFSRMLWTLPATGFVPHCAADDRLAALTPVIIDSSGENPAHDDVLLNLHHELPSFFGRFRRLIEIVSIDEQDRHRARERFRFYRDRGYEIRSHDLSQRVQ
jgi:DNA polymerase-3 subunit chi